MLNGCETGFGKDRKEDEKFVHEVSDSLWLTVVLAAVLVFCDLRGSTDWVNHPVFGAGYALLFWGFCFSEKSGEKPG